jgi:hypothetical protein
MKRIEDTQMNEEITNLNTDFKELFVNSQLEELVETLDKTENEIIHEITLFNYEIIKKYYDTEKYTVLFQYIKFVAYSSFLCDYSVNRQIIGDDTYQGMSSIFENIYNLIKQPE